ncbi:MAG: S-layer homology domain-containing protein [Clostridia bacterium]|nr:S-layer homology domain-containing protein [Clostridia bacterium]
MKKILSILLSVLMLVSVSATVALAGNGPSEEKWTWENEEGVTETSYYAFAYMIELDDNGLPVPDGQGLYVSKQIFSDNEAKNEVPGAVYDRFTNTLTLTDFNQPNYGLSLNMMGDDFKIKVVGECALAGIVSYGDGWGCSIALTGDGTLSVNQKLLTEAGAFVFLPEGAAASCLTVGPDVSLHLYSENGVVFADGVDENEEIIVLSREPSEDLRFEMEQATESRPLSVDVINTLMEPEELNVLVLDYKDDDGTGIWAGNPTEWHDGEGGPLIKEGYSVRHFVKSEEPGEWIVDLIAARDLGYPFGTLDLSTEEFNEMGFSVDTVDGNENWTTLRAYEYFTTNTDVFTDGVNDYVQIWDWDEEKGESIANYYTFKPVTGVDGLMMTDRLADVTYEDLEFKVTKTPIEGSYTKKVANRELHIGKDSELKPTVTFKDVPADAYYADAVAWAVRNNITTGTDKTHFSPNAGCTRGQVVTFLWRAAGEPEPTSAKNPFVDVKSDAYYYKAVLWAVEKGITNGTDKTHFSPNATCTRGQIVAFLYRWKGSPKPASANNPFTDVKKGDYYLDAVLWAVGKEITTGTDKTHFSPGATCTRAQVVTFMYRGR